VIDSLQLLERLLARYGPQCWWPGGDEPFEVMVGALLVQRTAWTNAERAIDRLRAAGLLHSDALSEVTMPRLRRYIRPVGFYNVKATRLRRLARYVRGLGGVDQLARMSSPALRESLLRLDGVGPETADAILLYAFERPACVIDDYTRRLFTRLVGCAKELPDVEIRGRVLDGLASSRQLNEFHALVIEHGKRYCRKAPDCRDCCLVSHCAFGRAA